MADGVFLEGPIRINNPRLVVTVTPAGWVDFIDDAAPASLGLRVVQCASRLLLSAAPNYYKHVIRTVTPRLLRRTPSDLDELSSLLTVPISRDTLGRFERGHRPDEAWELLPAALDHLYGADGWLGQATLTKSRSGSIRFPFWWRGPIWLRAAAACNVKLIWPPYNNGCASCKVARSCGSDVQTPPPHSRSPSNQTSS